MRRFLQSAAFAAVAMTAAAELSQTGDGAMFDYLPSGTSPTVYTGRIPGNVSECDDRRFDYQSLLACVGTCDAFWHRCYLATMPGAADLYVVKDSTNAATTAMLSAMSDGWVVTNFCRDTSVRDRNGRNFGEACSYRKFGDVNRRMEASAGDSLHMLLCGSNPHSGRSEPSLYEFVGWTSANFGYQYGSRYVSIWSGDNPSDIIGIGSTVFDDTNVTSVNGSWGEMDDVCDWDHLYQNFGDAKKPNNKKIDGYWTGTTYGSFPETCFFDSQAISDYENSSIAGAATDVASFRSRIADEYARASSQSTSPCNVCQILDSRTDSLYGFTNRFPSATRRFDWWRWALANHMMSMTDIFYSGDSSAPQIKFANTTDTISRGWEGVATVTVKLKQTVSSVGTVAFKGEYSDFTSVETTTNYTELTTSTSYSRDCVFGVEGSTNNMLSVVNSVEFSTPFVNNVTSGWELAILGYMSDKGYESDCFTHETTFHYLASGGFILTMNYKGTNDEDDVCVMSCSVSASPLSLLPPETANIYSGLNQDARVQQSSPMAYGSTWRSLSSTSRKAWYPSPAALLAYDGETVPTCWQSVLTYSGVVYDAIAAIFRGTSGGPYGVDDLNNYVMTRAGELTTKTRTLAENQAGVQTTVAAVEGRMITDTELCGEADSMIQSLYTEDPLFDPEIQVKEVPSFEVNAGKVKWFAGEVTGDLYVYLEREKYKYVQSLQISDEKSKAVGKQQTTQAVTWDFDQMKYE